MKNFNTALVGALVLALAFTSCKKDDDGANAQNPSTNNNPQSFADLSISNGFNFNSAEDVNLTVDVSSVTSNNMKITVFDGKPESDGEVLTSGITDGSGLFSTTFKVATAIDRIYIQRTDNVGNKVVEEVLLRNNNINYAFSGKTAGKKSNANSITVIAATNCSTGCTTSYTSNFTGNITINKNDHVCIPSGVTFTGGITFKGGTLSVCGTANLSFVNENGSKGAKIYVGPTGAINASSINLNKSSSEFVNYGSAVSISSGPNLSKGVFQNHGTMTMSSGINVNSGAEWLNTGTLTSNGNVNNNDLLVNQGTLNITGNLHNNGSADLFNTCAINVTGDFHQNNDFENSGYVSVTGITRFNGGSKTEMEAGALIVTDDAVVNGEVKGPKNQGAYARVDVADNTTINGGAKLKEDLDWCDATGIETNNGNVDASVTFCNAYIPSSSCNPGAGTNPTPVDTDSDGIPDAQDEYPNDATRAFNSWYPTLGTNGSIAFEDLWPSKGDYDFNDMVVSYNFNNVLNASNDVVEIKAQFYVRAIGGTFDNGFGVQFDNLVSSDIASVTGTNTAGSVVSYNANGTEAGQAKAVVVVFQSAENVITRATGSFFNTIPSNPKGAADTLDVVITLTTPMSPASLGTAPFNPFMFVDQDRTVEVHLPNKAPTSIANTALFGTGNDDSDPGSGRYYKSETNLPWALDLPNTFDYPTETTDMITAHLLFAAWAQSSGSNNTDWYQDNSGHRDPTKIFQ